MRLNSYSYSLPVFNLIWWYQSFLKECIFWAACLILSCYAVKVTFLGGDKFTFVYSLVNLLNTAYPTSFPAWLMLFGSSRAQLMGCTSKLLIERAKKLGKIGLLKISVVILFNFVTVMLVFLIKKSRPLAIFLLILIKIN
jgi:hypothetical protein